MTRNNAFRQMVGGRTGRAKICEMFLVYFTRNPDEEMTAADAVVKFGLTDRSSVWKSAEALVRRGMLSSAKAERRPPAFKTEPVVYSIGPELRRIVGGGS